MAYAQIAGGLGGDGNIVNLTAKPRLSVTPSVFSALPNLGRKGLIA